MSSRHLAMLPLNLFMLLFALSAYLALTPSYDPSLGQTTLRAVLISIGAYFFVAYATRNDFFALGFYGLLVIAGGLFALYFITQFGHQNYPEPPAIIRQIGQLTTFPRRLGNIYIHPNAAATFLEAILPLAVAVAISGANPLLKAVGIIPALLMLYAIVLTVSRGSWIGLGGVAGITLLLAALLYLPRRAAILTALAGIALVILGGWLFIAFTSERLSFVTATLSTASSRLTLYRNSLYLAGDYTFTGIGLGDTFALMYSRFSLLIQVPFLTYSHNLPLNVWLGQGLLGLSALLAVIVTFYVFVYRVIRWSKPTVIFHGAWLGVTATLLHGMSDARQYIESPWVMPALFIGVALTVGLGQITLRRNYFEPEQSPTDWSLIFKAGVVALVIIGAVFVLRRPLLTALFTNIGAVYEARADSFTAPEVAPSRRAQLTASAETYYRMALAYDPQYANANRRLGNLLWNAERFAEAPPYLEIAAAQEVYNPAAIKGLGLAYVWAGKTEAAAETFKRLDDPKAMTDELYTWGFFRREQKQPLLTAYAWETAELLSGGSNNLDVWLGIADDYRTAQMNDKAREWYQKVLGKDPSQGRAKEGLAALGG
jgi:O-antigen ligase